GRQPEIDVAGLADDAKIDFWRRVIADDSGQFDAHAGNAATAFSENAAANESDRALVNRKRKIVECAGLACLHLDALNRPDAEARLAKRDAIESGRDVR